MFEFQIWYIYIYIDGTTINAIHAAMEQIMLDMDNSVNFRPKQAHNLDYLYIFPGEGSVRKQDERKWP